MVAFYICILLNPLFLEVWEQRKAAVRFLACVRLRAWGRLMTRESFGINKHNCQQNTGDKNPSLYNIFDIGCISSCKQPKDPVSLQSRVVWVLMKHKLSFLLWTCSPWIPAVPLNSPGGPKVFLIWLRGTKNGEKKKPQNKTKAKPYKNTHRSLTSLMFTTTWPTVCKPPPLPPPSLRDRISIRLPFSKLVKGVMGFHLLRLYVGLTPPRWPQQRSQRPQGILLLSTCQLRTGDSNIWCEFPGSLIWGNITSKGNCLTFVVPLSNTLH